MTTTITAELLDRSRAGDAEAERLVSRTFYEALHGVAANMMKGERPNHTLEPGDLVHEALAKLLAGENVTTEDRAHALALAARIMRHVLVDHARRRLADKRGGGAARVPIDEALDAAGGWSPDRCVALDDALERLDRLDPMQASVVTSRVFARLKWDEIAQSLSVSETTAKLKWRLARAWLRANLSPSDSTNDE